MRKITTGLVALLLLCLLTPVARAQDKATLSLRLTKGQKFEQTMETVQKITQDVQGVKQNVDQTMTFVISQNVVEVDSDGVATVEIVYDAVKWAQTTPAGRTSYDSTKDKEAAGPAKAFAALVGAKLTGKMGRDGKVTELKGSDELMKKVLDSLDLPPGPQTDLMKKQFKTQFSEESMRKQIENLSAIYPDGPVAVGDTWNKKLETNQGMALSLDTNYTYKGRKDGAVMVDVAGKLGTPADAKPLELGTMKMAMKLSGTQKGTLQLDEKTGMVSASDIVQDIAGTTSVQDANGNELVKFPMTINSKVKVTTVLK